jgi:hypothetical protein
MHLLNGEHITQSTRYFQSLYHDFLERERFDLWFLTPKNVAATRRLLNQGSITWKVSRSPHGLVNHYRVAVSQMITWYVPFVVVAIRSFPHSWLITWLITGFATTSNTTGATCGTGTAYPSGAPALISVFLWGWCCSIFRFLCNVL